MTFHLGMEGLRRPTARSVIFDALQDVAEAASQLNASMASCATLSLAKEVYRRPPPYGLQLLLKPFLR